MPNAPRRTSNVEFRHARGRFLHELWSERMLIGTQLEASNNHRATTISFTGANAASTGVGFQAQSALDGFARFASNLCN